MRRTTLRRDQLDSNKELADCDWFTNKFQLLVLVE